MPAFTLSKRAPMRTPDLPSERIDCMRVLVMVCQAIVSRIKPLAGCNLAGSTTVSEMVRVTAR